MSEFQEKFNKAHQKAKEKCILRDKPSSESGMSAMLEISDEDSKATMASLVAQ